jgi:hypothetical protein
MTGTLGQRAPAHRRNRQSLLLDFEAAGLTLETGGWGSPFANLDLRSRPRRAGLRREAWREGMYVTKSASAPLRAAPTFPACQTNPFVHRAHRAGPTGNVKRRCRPRRVDGLQCFRGRFPLSADRRRCRPRTVDGLQFFRGTPSSRFPLSADRRRCRPRWVDGLQLFLGNAPHKGSRSAGKRRCRPRRVDGPHLRGRRFVHNGEASQ